MKNNTKQHYKHLKHDPTIENNAAINKVLTRFQNDKLVSNNVTDGLKVESPRTPCFYIQPKIHKEGNRGRPVTSSLNSDTSKISEYIDYHLQQIVKQIPTCMKHTADFLLKLDAIKSLPDNAYLAFLDVKSLYTNIPNAQGIKAVK